MFGWRLVRKDNLLDQIKFLEKQSSDFLKERQNVEKALKLVQEKLVQERKLNKRLRIYSIIITVILFTIIYFSVVNTISDNWNILESRLWLVGFFVTSIQYFSNILKRI